VVQGIRGKRLDSMAMNEKEKHRDLELHIAKKEKGTTRITRREKISTEGARGHSRKKRDLEDTTAE